MNIIVVTGMSGAGKTVVGNVLEDFGYYCIDNIPVRLINQFVDLYLNQEKKNKKIALIVDVRGCDDFSELIDAYTVIKHTGDEICKLIYLDASTEVLIKRYKESRHVHPLVLSKHITLSDAIDCERKMLEQVRAEADHIIDTSTMSIAKCRERVISIISDTHIPNMCVSCVSFGFKYGIPADSDLMFDVRCLPNPFYVEELKTHTGLESCVYDYVMSFENVKRLQDKLHSLIDYLMPLYIEDGRTHLTISVGCTGGKHRSVAIVEALVKHLNELNICSASAAHRDICK